MYAYWGRRYCYADEVGFRLLHCLRALELRALGLERVAGVPGIEGGDASAGRSEREPRCPRGMTHVKATCKTIYPRTSVTLAFNSTT